MKKLLLVRQTSHLRQISEEEALNTLSAEDQRLNRLSREVSMSDFKDAVEQGDWSNQDRFLREQAAILRQDAEVGDTTVHFFGLAEVPHMIALGAHFGDEYAVELHDHDRETGRWEWPEKSPTLQITSKGGDDLTSVIRARGAAVIRVAISASVSDSDVREVVGDETIADITITHADAANASVARVRSAEDVIAVRREFRRVFALLRNFRPNVDTLHLFVAAPPSLCFSVGQELTLRNSPPFSSIAIEGLARVTLNKPLFGFRRSERR